MKTKQRRQTKAGKAARQPRKARQPGIMGNLIRQLGAMGGGALGTLVGQPTLGASTGHSLGASLSRWLGSGDYSVSSNSLVTKASTGIPYVHKTNQSVTIRHREFIMNVPGQAAFTVHQGLPLNPGMASTFPWLSQIAQGFEEYEFKGLVFHYVPTSGMMISGTNPALGSVMMQTSYRASGTAPSGKNELLNEYWAGESVPSEPFCHPIECDPKENPFNVKYVRSTSPPEGDSILLYDTGTTFVASSGMTATNPTLGDLWVTYEVVLKKPVVRSNVDATPYCMFYFGSATVANPFEGLVATYGRTDITVSGNKITFPANERGTFRVAITLYSPTATIQGGSFTSFASLTNLTGINLLPPNLTTSQTGTAGVTAGAVATITGLYTFAKTNDAQVGVVAFNSVTVVGTYTGCSVEITRLD